QQQCVRSNHGGRAYASIALESRPPRYRFSRVSVRHMTDAASSDSPTHSGSRRQFLPCGFALQEVDLRLAPRATRLMPEGVPLLTDREGRGSFEGLLDAWDGETAIIRRDREGDGWIFICLHSSRLGPSGGGTRMKVYATPAEGLEDAMQLSAAMTRKLAVA